MRSLRHITNPSYFLWKPSGEPNREPKSLVQTNFSPGEQSQRHQPAYTKLSSRIRPKHTADWSELLGLLFCVSCLNWTWILNLIGLQEVLQPCGKPQNSGSWGNPQISTSFFSRLHFKGFLWPLRWGQNADHNIRNLQLAHTFLQARNPPQPICCCRTCTSAVCLSETLLYPSRLHSSLSFSLNLNNFPQEAFLTLPPVLSFQSTTHFSS